ncbi:MAG: DUF4410 domain-containing protein [Rickettsiales bacterium]|nr:DUF4410 domain-containing protein [Rickettsiales bacterium]
MFRKVTRKTTSNPHALIIDGSITKYDEGNPVLRTLVGFGAGSSKFDAKVYVKDSKSKKLLANLDVNKHSWALGGAIASAQDVKSHMHVAASKIGDEIAKAK